MKLREPQTESQRALRVLAGAMLGGVLSILVYAFHAGGRAGFLAVMSVGVLLAGASAFVGGTLGFLFGIPRTLQQEGTTSPADASHARPDSTPPARVDYRVNTNLEQISDWLTKILVGVGLTQISGIRQGISSLTNFAAQGLGPPALAQVFALALLSYSFVLGFLFGYLWTRLFLAGALRAADQASIGALVAEVQKVTKRTDNTERKLEEMKKQSELDAAALNLAYRQLNPSADLPAPSQGELDAAVIAASKPIKLQLFNQAWQVRSENWKDESTKPKVEGTIALFKALINDDSDNHMLHGQLGLALKDKSQPDWAAAEKELTTAIEMRGPWEENGWLYYESNRALCRINLDPDFASDRLSDPQRKTQILQDLRAAVHATAVLKWIKSDPVFQRWMKLNDLHDKDLRRITT